jgi:hypothetical protein
MSKSIAIAAVLVGVALGAPGVFGQKDKPKPKSGKGETAVAPPVAPAGVIDPKCEAEAADIGKLLGKEMFYFESDHFSWCTCLPEPRMRPLMEAAEANYRKFVDDSGIGSTTGAKPEAQEFFPDQRPLGVIVQTKREYETYVAWYAEKHVSAARRESFQSAHKSDRFYFTSSTRPTLVTHVKPSDDDFIKSVMAHLATHMMIKRYCYHNNSIPPWFEEGAAAFYEGDTLGRLACRCFSGNYYGAAVTDAELVRGQPLQKFKQKAKADVLGKRCKNLSAMFKLTLGELTLEDIEKSYAVVAWMVSQPGKLASFLKATKKHWPKEVQNEFTEAQAAAQVAAFKEVFGMTLEQVEAAVRTYVQKF